MISAATKRRIRAMAFAVLTASLAAVSAQAAPPKPPTQSIADAKGCKMWDQSIPPESTVTWSGTCKNGFMDGKGILQWFKSGKPTDRYEGDLKDGYYDGFGTYFWDGGNRYDGQLKKGFFHGKAVHTYTNGNRFVGEYKDDQRSHGTMTFANGSRYEGDWSDDKAHGAGTLKSADGQSFTGTWTNGCIRLGNRRAAVGVELAKCP